MKKIYMKPAAELYTVKVSSLLAGSVLGVSHATVDLESDSKKIFWDDDEEEE